jgi:hypothetical protein
MTLTEGVIHVGIAFIAARRKYHLPTMSHEP